MEKDPKIFLLHILESIANIEDYTADLTKGDFYDSVEKQDAIVRRLEIIGEATRNLPEGFRKSNPEVPWQDIAGMRSKLIHEYFGVDLDLVWTVVHHDLPPFKRQVEKLLKEG